MNTRFKQFQDLHIQSENLDLHILDQSWSGEVLDYHVQNRAFFSFWNPIPRPRFWTQKFQEAKLKEDREALLSKRQVKFWLFEQDDPPTIIGHINYSNLVWGGFLSCFLGYSISQKHNGKGYATEAVSRSVKFMFEQAHLHRIEANIIPRNKASIRVVEKAGFEYEGRSTKYLKINGTWEDHLHYVVRNHSLE